MVDFPLSFFICYQLSKDYTGYNLDILCFDDVGYNYHEWRINMLQASHQEHRTKMKSSTAIKPLDFYLLSASQKKWATRCFSQTCKMPGWALAPQLRRMRTLRTRMKTMNDFLTLRSQLLKRKGAGTSDELWWFHVQTRGNDLSLLVNTITYWVWLSSSGFQKDRHLGENKLLMHQRVEVCCNRITSKGISPTELYTPIYGQYADLCTYVALPLHAEKS